MEQKSKNLAKIGVLIAVLMLTTSLVVAQDTPPASPVPTPEVKVSPTPKPKVKSKVKATPTPKTTKNNSAATAGISAQHSLGEER